MGDIADWRRGGRGILKPDCNPITSSIQPLGCIVVMKHKNGYMLYRGLQAKSLRGTDI